MEERWWVPPNEARVLAAVLFVIFSFRFVSLPILIGAVWLARRLGRRNPWAVAVRALFFLSLLSPVDVSILGAYRGGRVHRSGPRLVRCVVGLPRHGAIFDQHGEYYWLGCSGYTVNNPGWMLAIH